MIFPGVLSFFPSRVGTLEFCSQCQKVHIHQFGWEEGRFLCFKFLLTVLKSSAERASPRFTRIKCHGAILRLGNMTL